jgi:hypothetical protein
MMSFSFAAPAPGRLLSTSAICCPTKLVTRFYSAGNQRVPAVALPFYWTAVVTSWDSWGSGREALPCHLALGMPRHVPH